jgi:acyl-CoA synthetase (AMP-forming)/AMP-acid ligase II
METVPAVVAHAAREFGREPALVDPYQRRWNFAELHDDAQTVSRALIASGIEPGDRVALWAPNSARWVLAALGILGAGATLVPINTRFTGAEAADILTRSNAKGLIVTGPFCRCRTGTPSSTGLPRLPRRPLRTGPQRYARTTSVTSSSPPGPPGSARA